MVKKVQVYYFIFSVQGLLGDYWKDKVLPGPYKLVEDLDVPHTGGRPVYQKLDKGNFYLNYYEPYHEWGFRSKEALGLRRSYAYLKPLLVRKLFLKIEILKPLPANVQSNSNQHDEIYM